MSGTVPGATFFIMSSVIIKGNPGTINQIYYLLNKGINNNIEFENYRKNDRISDTMWHIIICTYGMTHGVDISQPCM